MARFAFETTGLREGVVVDRVAGVQANGKARANRALFAKAVRKLDQRDQAA
jgi:hypothetical protein